MKMCSASKLIMNNSINDDICSPACDRRFLIIDFLLYIYYGTTFYVNETILTLSMIS